jgi:uncharacterized membrane protein YukC
MERLNYKANKRENLQWVVFTLFNILANYKFSLIRALDANHRKESRLNFTKKNLEDAVNQNIISFEQSEKLIDFLNKQSSTAPKFDFTHVLYYIG